MTVVREERLSFEFPGNWHVIKYDECSFYRNQVAKSEDVKAVDLLADSGTDFFMIEIKDFRGSLNPVL